MIFFNYYFSLTFFIFYSNNFPKFIWLTRLYFMQLMDVDSFYLGIWSICFYKFYYIIKLDCIYLKLGHFSIGYLFSSMIFGVSFFVLLRKTFEFLILYNVVSERFISESSSLIYSKYFFYKLLSKSK